MEKIDFVKRKRKMASVRDYRCHSNFRINEKLMLRAVFKIATAV